MADSVAITLTLKTTDANKKVLYDKTLGGTVKQDVTHHGRFTVSTSAADEKHSFPDIPPASDNKQTFAVFLPGADIDIRVGLVTADKRRVMKDVPAMFHDIADNGDFFFSTSSTTAVDIEYFVGQVT